VPTTKSTLFAIKRLQRRTPVSLSRMHCMYSSMVKGTSWAEATLNSEKFKPVALAIVKLHWSEGIS